MCGSESVREGGRSHGGLQSSSCRWLINFIAAGSSRHDGRTSHPTTTLQRSVWCYRIGEQSTCPRLPLLLHPRLPRRPSNMWVANSCPNKVILSIVYLIVIGSSSTVPCIDSALLFPQVPLCVFDLTSRPTCFGAPGKPGLTSILDSMGRRILISLLLAPGVSVAGPL